MRTSCVTDLRELYCSLFDAFTGVKSMNGGGHVPFNRTRLIIWAFVKYTNNDVYTMQVINFRYELSVMRCGFSI